ncbi:hypothetical protein CCYA_CCYA15G3943 [Cyanidiococcus yangmingshanensis]|nr:hypothetical protein CCYA_CCYA15G3943 [Cyanidiococcus yangmingshanensis]
MFVKTSWRLLGPLAYLVVLFLVFCMTHLALVDSLPQATFPYATRFQVVCWQLILLGSFVTVSLRDPGTITPATRGFALLRYCTYDGLLYEAGHLCPSCGLERVPRASHSSATDRCVECHDHYCIWVNNDIGRRNRWLFVNFLILHFCALTHGVLMCGSVLLEKVCQCYSTKFGKVLCLSKCIQKKLDCRISDQCLCMLVFTGLLVLFGYMLGFQLHLAARNMTTKEYYKWRAVQLAWKEYTSTTDEPSSMIRESRLSAPCGYIRNRYTRRKHGSDEARLLSGKHSSESKTPALRSYGSPSHAAGPALAGHGPNHRVRDNLGLAFPYDRGSFWKNMLETFTGAQQSSRIWNCRQSTVPFESNVPEPGARL